MKTITTYIFFIAYKRGAQALSLESIGEMMFFLARWACQPQTSRQSTTTAEVALCIPTLPIAVASSIDGFVPPMFRQGLGNSHLSINTRSAEAQRWFDQGLNQPHDFWLIEAYRAFLQVIRMDSTCAMGYWGVAMCQPGDHSGLTDEDDADPDYVIITQCLNSNLAAGVILSPKAIRSQNDVAQITFGLTNPGAVALSGITLVGQVKPFNRLKATPVTLTNQSYTNNDGMATLIASLAAGASTTRNISFTVNAGVTGNLTNTAEISAASGGTDVDSSPNNNPNNDGTPKNDGIINEDGQNGSDPDDSDPKVITVSPTPVFDLTLTKKLASGPTIAAKPGYKVTFTITVHNQGTATTTLPGTLASGMSTTVNLVLQVASTFTGTSLVNKAEISSAKDSNGNTVTDIDSTPDQNPANDAGGKENSPSDDAINGNETGTPGGTEAATDEDLTLVIVSQCKEPNCVDSSIIIVK